MDSFNYPKVLIISRGVWDDTQGTSSTLTNIFEDYDPNCLAHIYIETKQPNTRCCHLFFQISEFSLVHKIFKWGTKTGHSIDTKIDVVKKVSDRIASQEQATMRFVRGHRSLFYSMLREILWGFNGWKSKELKEFIESFNPDVIWMDGSPLPLMYRLYNHVLKIARKPASIFMQDDVYTYESCGNNFWARVRKHRLRHLVRSVVMQCDNMFVASPKMKKEYDDLFGVNSTFIAKSFNMDIKDFGPKESRIPLRMVYMGQVIYGRIKTLISISEALKDINKESTKIQLFIYTNNKICKEDKMSLTKNGNVFIEAPVPYSEVANVINDNDVVVFVETFDSKLNNIARLSFSTKISDYLRSGKCVFAIGPSNVAPIEYFLVEDAAIVSTCEEDIRSSLEKLVRPGIINEYATKAQNCALKNHERRRMDNLIYGILYKLSMKGDN